MAAGFDSVTAAAARSVLGATQYDKDKFALGADGQRFTAGGQDPKVTSALGAYQLALDKVQNYGKCYLTTGVDAGTTNRRKDELQAAMNAAFAGYQDALASSQSSAASALKPYEKASVTPGRGAVAGGYEIRFVRHRHGWAIDTFASQPAAGRTNPCDLKRRACIESRIDTFTLAFGTLLRRSTRGPRMSQGSVCDVHEIGKMGEQCAAPPALQVGLRTNTPQPISLDSPRGCLAQLQASRRSRAHRDARRLVTSAGCRGLRARR
jgi:hypothetical protein